MHTLDSHVVELHPGRSSCLPYLGTHTELKYEHIELKFCTYNLWVLKFQFEVKNEECLCYIISHEI